MVIGPPQAADAAPWYVRPEAFARERRGIFAAEWLMLGRSGALPAPGDYLSLGIAGWPVVAMRDAGGGLGAFRNQCRHQGLPILDAGHGHCESLRCRYHGWTYDLRGRFIGAPSLAMPPGPVGPLHDLQRLAFGEWRGFVFVTLAEAAPPFAEFADGLAGQGLALVAPERFAGEAAIEIAADWKLVVEAALAQGGGATPSWHWPNLVFAATAEGSTLTQIVPRAYQRSRAVAYRFGAALADPASPLAALKEAAEAAQAAGAPGTADAASGPPAQRALRARVAALHAAATA